MTGATIERIAAMVREGHKPGLSSVIVPLQPKGTRTPLFFMHPAGGSLLCYRPLVGHLGEDQPFFGLRWVEGLSEGDPYAPIPLMARHYAEAIVKLYPNGPYLLGGWSFGGVVAFEVAQQLSASGHTVSLVAMLDTVAPARSSLDFDDTVCLAAVTRELGYMGGRNLAVSIRDMRRLNAEQQLDYAVAKMRDAGLIGTEVGREWAGELLRVYRSSIQVTRQYQPAVYRGRITLFRSNEMTPEDYQFLAEAFEMTGAPAQPPVAATPPNQTEQQPVGSSDWGGQTESLDWAMDDTLGWQSFTTDPVDVRYVPGTHLTLVSDPQVKALADRLRPCIAEVSEGTA